MKRDGTPLDETRAARIREERDLIAEFEAHLAHRVDDLTAQGVDEADARARAMAEFGDAAELLERSRAARAAARKRHARGSRTDALRQDLLFAIRQLGRAPGFAVAALTTLTLGVGVTATIVSVVDAVVLEPLPFQEPEGVVFPETLTPQGQRFAVSEPAFLDWRARARSFAGMAAADVRGATLRSPGEPRSIRIGHVSHQLLDVLGVQPRLGRMFEGAEDQPGAQAPVALVSHETWRTEFAGTSDAIGAALDLDGRRYRVIGVMPPALELLFGDAPVFVPLGADPYRDRGDHHLTIVARLAAGATLEGARTELAEIQRQLGETHAADAGWSATVHTSEEILLGASTVRAGWILLSAAGLLLLMACVNVSNLLMVRATARQAEMGLRAALGASRGRLARQLFTESALLAGVAGLLGLAFARLAVPLVRTLGEGRIPRLEEAGIDPTALLASVAAVGVASLAVALAPIVRLRSRTVGQALSAGGRGSLDAGGRLRSFLVGAQVAVTVVLLAGTGLLLRSFVELTRVDPGFEAEGTLAVRLDMPDQSYTWEERGDLLPVIRASVEAVPGVTAVGATAVDPLRGSTLANFVARVDRMPERAADFTPVQWRVVTPGFFEAMGMEVKAGRTFRDSDERTGLMRVVIGERLAGSLYGDDDPIDQVLVWGDPQGSRLRVIGVVGDLRDVAIDADPEPIIYRPHRQIPWAVMTLVARVEGNATAAAEAVRASIRQAAPGLPVREIRSLETNVRDAVAQPRFHLQLLTVFAVLGLALAIVGVYGLTAFDVRRRFREIGIRLSLGAEPEQIQHLFLRRRLRLTAIGLVVGLVVASGLVTLIESQLFGISAADPLTWLAVVAVVSLTSGAATWVPARRATRVDPTVVLAAE